MSPQFAAQRAADEFARAVDGPVSTRVADRYAELTRTVTLLREQPRPVPRSEFVADLRERLLAAADEALLPVAVPSAGSHRPRRAFGWRERHLGAAAAALVLVGGTAGLAAAAQGSLPGQTLYPLKRGIEQVEVQISAGDSARGQQMLDQANTRLSEVRALVEQPHTADSSTLIASTLADFQSSANNGASLLFTNYQADSNGQDIATVRAFTTGSMSTLQSLASQSPAGIGTALSQAGAVVAQLDQQARVLCVTCSAAAPVNLPDALVSLTSAQSLQQLVSLPTLRAQHAAQLAHAAEKVATSGGVATGQPTEAPSPSGSPSALPTSAAIGSLPTLSSHPVKDLVTGLTTSKLPVVGQLGETLDGVTSPLVNTVKGVTDGLGQTLSNLVTPSGGSTN